MTETKSHNIRIRTDTYSPSADSNYVDVTKSMMNAAKEKANFVVESARDWLKPTTDWANISQLESLSTVMFSPLAAHPVYRSEAMVKALQLMQQQQQRPTTSLSTPSNNIIATRQDYVLQGNTYAWPSSKVLLQADIPETSSPVSLYQGFSSAYPSFTRTKSKKQKQKKKKMGAVSVSGMNSITSNGSKGIDSPRSLTQIISEREKRARDYDKISMQKSSTANEIEQINLQINELLNQRKTLELRWEKLESKDLQLQLILEDLNEAIVDIEEGGSVRNLKLDEEDSDEEHESGACIKTLSGHTDEVICLDFNHPKGMLVSSSLDGTVKAWDLYRNRCLGNLNGHNGLVRCLQLDDARLLTGSDDGTIKQWDLTLIPPVSSSLSISSFSAFSSAPSSPTLTAADNVGIINESFTLEGHQGEVTAIYADRHTVVSGSNDKTMKQWDLETQECMLTLDVMWASKTSSKVDNWFDYNYSTHDFIGALQFWEFALASGTSDGRIRMWDLRTGQAHRTLPGHSAPITSLQFDEVHLVSCSLDKTIRIWDLRTGSVFDTLTYTTPISSLQFDSNKIISAGHSSEIDIYNRTSFQHIQLNGHSGRVNSVSFHNDLLASAGSDKVIKLWSL